MNSCLVLAVAADGSDVTTIEGKREYEVVEEALRRHLGFAGAVEQVWAGISPEDAPSEEEATRVAAQELGAVRAERSSRTAG